MGISIWRNPWQSMAIKVSNFPYAPKICSKPCIPQWRGKVWNKSFWFSFFFSKAIALPPSQKGWHCGCSLIGVHNLSIMGGGGCFDFFVGNVLGFFFFDCINWTAQELQTSYVYSFVDMKEISLLNGWQGNSYTLYYFLSNLYISCRSWYAQSWKQFS